MNDKAEHICREQVLCTPVDCPPSTYSDVSEEVGVSQLTRRRVFPDAGAWPNSKKTSKARAST